jgi:urea transport system permease protein
MDVFLSQLFAGLSVGSILLLIALGLTFTFGQMNVINMAHGELIMAGAYTTYVMQGGASQSGFQPGPALLVALPVAFLIAGLIGLLLERALIRRLYGRPLDTLLATWGVSLILQQLARDIFGAPNVQVRSPGWLDGGLQLGGVTLPYARLFMMALVIAAVAAIWVFLTRLPHGRRMRSVMQNRQLASASGVHTARVDALTFFIGSGLAGIAGVALTLLGSVGPTLGVNYIIDAFLVVIVGGLGQLRGAILAAFSLGVLNAFVEYGTQASLAKVVVFLAIVAFLQLRPQGMFVMRSRALT